MKVLLISGGHIDEAFADSFCREHYFDKIIAVDGGLEMAHRLGLASRPETGVLTDIVGDFDTVSPDILEQYKSMSLPDCGGQSFHGPKIHKFNPEKDYTDTDIALKLAVEYCQDADAKEADAKNADAKEADAKDADAKEADAKDAEGSSGCGEIWILGATGTRLDHVLANITMLLVPFRCGIQAWIADANNRICLLSGKMVIERKNHFGQYLSLIPLTRELVGVTLTGVKYPLKNHRVALGESLCVSNEITDTEAVIEIGSGIAVVLETKD